MPDTIAATLELKGVGEKIALLYGVIALGEVRGVPVDVNMLRIMKRLGLVRGESPRKVREFLEGALKREEWGKVNKLMVGFGQQICLPNGREKCGECLLRVMCEHYKNKNE